MSLFPLKPTSAHVKKYYEALALSHKHGHTTEGNTRFAFEELLRRCASPYGWHVVPEYAFKGTDKQQLRADGALVDDLTLVHGIWEAKDSDDDLTKEVGLKFKKGYPLKNILFQSPGHAVLYQDSIVTFNDAITTPEKLIEVLTLFFDHRQPHEVDWEEAVTKFAEKIPDLANGVTTILEAEYKKNATFRENFEAFADLCRQSINPDLTNDAVFKMLVQHLLTERIFRKVFNNQEFLSRNVIAAEIEKVIHSITAKHFSRDSFLKPLDRFYTAIEKAAESQEGYTEKQHFLNAVYEKFFQRFDTKQADTMGIVYTPQPIVDFMVRSVDEILQQEFGKTLSDKGVHILDPFTGTGNFITRIMQQIKRSALPHKYAEELHCNEIMLLPYYIACMNIEHAYMEKVGHYDAFEGICLVDTFELSEFGQQSFAFSDSNTERVRKQKRAPIFVVIGNPPYNMGQDNENDENQNRHYKHWENRIKDTYTKDSQATLRNKLSDPYVKAFRWASDRIRTGGVIAFVTNNSFLDSLAFDGMRKHLAKDFNLVLHLDLKGNARTSGERRRREAGNIFEDQIRVGVGITLLVKNPQSSKHEVRIFQVGDYLKSAVKTQTITEFGSFNGTPTKLIVPDHKHTWLNEHHHDDFTTMMPLGSKTDKGDEGVEAVFRLFSLGVASNRDAWVYNSSKAAVKESIELTLETFRQEQARFQTSDREKFAATTDGSKIKWTDRLREALEDDKHPKFHKEYLRKSLYRPFDRRWMYFDHLMNQRRYQQHVMLPTSECESENRLIAWNTSPTSGMAVMATSVIPDLHFVGDSQCFSFYVYNEDGSNRRENITDWALAEFRTHYADKNITKWDIFHATYAVLHHPEYRTRYAANLKRELPRIPFPPDFHAFAAAGKRLMELHIDYEKQPEYLLEQIEDPKAEVSFRVERMRLSKDKTELTYNEFLKLRGIPAAAFDYRLGNRSALEWVIDQYRVSTDARSGIVNDPNREDDPQYILRLIGQVITVSLETQKIIASFPSLNLGG